MSEVKTPSLPELKATYEKLAFVHQCVTQKNQYYVEEFEIAKASIQMITEMANKLGKEIHDIEQAMAKAQAEQEAIAQQKAESELAAQVVEDAPVKSKSKRKSKKNLEVVSE